MEDLTLACRFCLGDSGRGINLFSVKNINYLSKASELFGIEIEDCPEWPTKVCRECIGTVDKLLELKDKVIATHSYLLGIQLEEVEVDPDEPSDTLIEIDQLAVNEDDDLIVEPKHDITAAKEGDGDEEEETTVAPPPAKRRGRPPKKPVNYDLEQEEEEEDVDVTVEIKKERKRGQRQDDAKQRAHEQYAARTETKELDALMVTMQVLHCDLCTTKKQFSSFRDLRLHFQDRHPLNRRPYIVCCGQKHGLQGARQHMRYHQNPDEFKCELCSENCLNHRDLLQHKRSKHLDALEESFTCETCGKVFAVRGQLKTHLLSHFPDELKKFRCEYCSKGFNCKPTLVAHIKAIHTKETDYCCEICGKAYASSNSLKTHIASHQEVKTQPCDVCGKQFFNVEKHKRRIHQEVERIPCGDCGKAIKKHLFAAHVRDLHSGAVWQCEFCQKVFKMQKTLKEHVNVHLGIKVDCIFCPFKATNSSNIIKHYYQQHPAEYAEHRANRYSEKRVKNSKEQL